MRNFLLSLVFCFLALFASEILSSSRDLLEPEMEISGTGLTEDSPREEVLEALASDIKESTELQSEEVAKKVEQEQSEEEFFETNEDELPDSLPPVSELAESQIEPFSPEALGELEELRKEAEDSREIFENSEKLEQRRRYFDAYEEYEFLNDNIAEEPESGELAGIYMDGRGAALYIPKAEPQKHVYIIVALRGYNKRGSIEAGMAERLDALQSHHKLEVNDFDNFGNILNTAEQRRNFQAARNYSTVRSSTSYTRASAGRASNGDGTYFKTKLSWNGHNYTRENDGITEEVQTKLKDLKILASYLRAEAGNREELKRIAKYIYSSGSYEFTAPGVDKYLLELVLSERDSKALNFLVTSLVTNSFSVQSLSKGQLQELEQSQSSNLTAKSLLGHLLYYGKMDQTRGEKLLKEAANSGEKFAARSTAIFLIAKGSHRKAKELLELAARQGLNEAVMDLGILYAEGSGLEQDFELSTKYFAQAGEKGSRVGALRHAEALRKGLGTPKNVEAAISLLKKEVRDGNRFANYYLGELYEEEKTNYQEAKLWYNKALLAGDGRAALRLALLASRTEPENSEKILDYLVEGAKLGNSQSKELYENYEGLL